MRQTDSVRVRLSSDGGHIAGDVAGKGSHSIVVEHLGGESGVPASHPVLLSTNGVRCNNRSRFNCRLIGSELINFREVDATHDERAVRVGSCCQGDAIGRQHGGSASSADACCGELKSDCVACGPDEGEVRCANRYNDVLHTVHERTGGYCVARQGHQFLPVNNTLHNRLRTRSECRSTAGIVCKSTVVRLDRPVVRSVSNRGQDSGGAVFVAICAQCDGLTSQDEGLATYNLRVDFGRHGACRQCCVAEDHLLGCACAREGLQHVVSDVQRGIDVQPSKALGVRHLELHPVGHTVGIGGNVWVAISTDNLV